MSVSKICLLLFLLIAFAIKITPAISQDRNWSFKLGVVAAKQNATVNASGFADRDGGSEKSILKGDFSTGYSVAIEKATPLTEKLSLTTGLGFVKFGTWISLEQRLMEFRLVYNQSGERKIYQVPVGLTYKLLSGKSKTVRIGATLTPGLLQMRYFTPYPIPHASHVGKFDGFMIHVRRRFEQETKRKPVVGGDVHIAVGPLFKRLELGLLYHWDFTSSPNITYETDVAFWLDAPTSPAVQPDVVYSSKGEIKPRVNYWMLQIGCKFNLSRDTPTE